MIPEWPSNGDLPAGGYFAQWLEVEARLAFNPRRRRFFAGLREACNLLRRAGCRLVYLDGSFVTTKPLLGDFDACWDVQGVDEERSIRCSGISRTAAGRRSGGFGGEFFSAQLPEGVTGRAFVEFFQVNKLTGAPKGIMAIRLRRGKKR